MSEQEDFLSRKHVRVLNIAAWAKYLAWVALIVFILWAISDFFGEMNIANEQSVFMGRSVMDFAGLFKLDPVEAMRLVASVINIFFKGIVYFLVLEGISAGLNMIVETDINYRDSHQSGGKK
ncbi:MAG TPA: hypothetical protein VLX61_12115 [Anaerolineales bacterium]|nr:hypothetical protein [Anaerolineales bacterium]